MGAKVSSPSPKRAQASVWIGASMAAARENVLLPWFRSASKSAWQESKPTVVAVPFHSHAYALKSFLLEHDVSLLGIHFLSPAQLRELLSGNYESRLPLREHLRLLLSIAAEESMELPSDAAARAARLLEPDYLTAKSVARGPDHLLRAIDKLGAAGWDFSALELPALREIEARFQKQLSDCGFELIHAADRRAAANASKVEPLLANLLVTGFNAAHWPLWPLLQAAVTSAKQTTVFLDHPQDETRELDETWIGSWEEMFGEAKPVFPSARQTNDSLFSEAEMRGDRVRPAACSFLVGANTTEQAEAVALLCLRFLTEEKCTRLGVVFARAGSLSRLAARALDRLAIPHHDGLGHLVPGLFETAEWRAWLELQRSPRIESFLRFFNSLANRSEIFPDLSSGKLERVLRRAHAEVLIDDLDLLREFCAAENPPIAEAIRSLGRFSPRATLATFLQQTEAACGRLGWKRHWLEITTRLGDWTTKVSSEFSRALYLRWLEEIAATLGLERSESGDHPYAPVQLLTVPQASGQEWSHLIFAGWNEGTWPPPAKGEFAREEEIAAFNQSVRQLNRRATRRGRQGEGHVSIRDGHTLYLGPVEQRQIALGQFESLRHSAAGKIALTAGLVQESEPERLWNPSELFMRLYQETEHRPLTQSAMRGLQETTRRWLDDSAGLTSASNVSSTAIQQTRVAYDQRRDASAKSGEYDFAFRSKPNRVPIFGVREFEQFLSAPALVWMKHYLGVKAAEDDANVWATASGIWIHDWLAAVASSAAKTFVPFLNASEIDRRVLAAAERKRAEIEALCRATRKTLPDWWRSGWQNALFLARSLGQKLATANGWPWISAEWKIESELPIEIAGGETLSFRGRIDLILARQEIAAGSLKADELWVIDYKTGAKRALKGAVKKRLLDGSALQLGLYALAARTLGAERALISILSPLVRPIEPQLSDTEISAEQDIFVDLACMQRTGIFGMHGLLRNTFRFEADYPLATLAVDPDTLEQRWELTHPALVRDEEDIFW